MKDIVVSIKTFLRDEMLYRCVESILRIYPEIKIAVCDDGNTTKEKEVYYKKLREGGHYVLRMPFDSGMTKGRNYIVDNTKEKYILYVDDDFVFTKDAGIEAMLEVLNKNSEIGLVAGRVRTDGRVNDYQGYIKIKGKKLFQIPLETDNWELAGGFKYKLCDLAFNYYLIRRDVFVGLKYDENAKIGCAHMDFYMMIKKNKWKIAFTPDACIDHNHNLFDMVNTEYEKYRKRKEGYKYLARKWSINKIYYFNNDLFDLRSLRKKKTLLKTVKLILGKIIIKMR